METPNKNSVNINVELMPFKKFAQSIRKLTYDEDTIKLNGTFKEKGSKEVVSGDIFEAHILGKLNIEEIYKVYLEWFNYTKTGKEKERVFVSVKRFQEHSHKADYQNV